MPNDVITESDAGRGFTAENRSRCHYRGDVVDALIEQAEAGHLFGPDQCGDRKVTEAEAREACLVGPISVLRQYIDQGSPQGARYQLTEATYDPDTDRTIADFKPHINPLDAVRYFGGDDTRQQIVPTSRLAKSDNIPKR